MSLNVPSIAGLPGLSIHASPDGGLPSVAISAPDASQLTASEAPKPPGADLTQVPTAFTGPVDLPANDPGLPVDVEEAQAPTVAEPVATAGIQGPVDVYVAPMSTGWQKFWQKLNCIGCCVPRN